MQRTWAGCLSLGVVLVVGACGDAGEAGDAAPIDIDAGISLDAGTMRPMTLVAALENGDIVTLDEATGSETVAIEVSSAGLELGKVSSMEYGIERDSWWLGLGGKADCRACLYELNAVTGEATRVGEDPNISRGLAGLCVDPADGALYTPEADGQASLYSIDPSTGVRTEVTNSLMVGSSGKGCAFTGPGQMILVGRDRLGQIDVAADYQVIATHDLTFTGFTFIDGTQSIGSLAVRGDGTVFAIVKDGGGVGNLQATYLATIDVVAAEVTFIGATSAPVDGLAYVPTSSLP